MSIVMVIEDSSKYGDEYKWLQKCDNCGNTKNNTYYGGEYDSIFLKGCICKTCGYELVGFSDAELNLRVLNQFTPLYCNPNIIPDYDGSLNEYILKLEHISELFFNFAEEFELFSKSGLEFKLFLEYHLNVNHLVFVKRKFAHKKRQQQKAQKFKTDSCYMCNSKDNLEIHHIIPISKGGNNDKTNLVTLCNKCHIKQHELHIR